MVFRSGVVAIVVLHAVSATASQSLYWGNDGGGLGGTWNSSNVNWFDGVQNVAWQDGSDAIFGGVGGVVTISNAFQVSSIAFESSGFTLSGGLIKSIGDNFIITTDFDATIASSLGWNSAANQIFTKTGAGTLTLTSQLLLKTLQVEQGELVLSNISSLTSNVVLGDSPDAILTLGGSSGSSVTFTTLSGGGTQGGIVRPVDQSSTVTLKITAGGSVFAGSIQDNGAGKMAISLTSGSSFLRLTGANTYSGPTTVSQTLVLAENGRATNTAIGVYGSSSSLVLDNSDTAIADRLGDSQMVTLSRGSMTFQGNASQSIEEAVGGLTFRGDSQILTSTVSGVSTLLTFGSVIRSGHGTLQINGEGVGWTGLANTAAGIVAPYVTTGNEWATVSPGGRITPYSAYQLDLNAGGATDNVKLTSSATLLASGEKASLNLSNSSASPLVVDLAGNSLNVVTGGILGSAGENAIVGGTITTDSDELIVTTRSNLTISASIGDSVGVTSLTKTGSGTLTLTGNNTFSGPVSIVRGILEVSSDVNLGMGSSVVFEEGGSLLASASFSSTKNLSGGYQNSSSAPAINTNGFDVHFEALNVPVFGKRGAGVFSLGSTTSAVIAVAGGAFDVPQVAGTYFTLDDATLQTTGSIPALYIRNNCALDIGGEVAAIIAFGSFGIQTNSSSTLSVHFGLGETQSDLVTFSNLTFSLNGPVEFVFQNLGGVVTGHDYLLFDMGAQGGGTSWSTSKFAIADASLAEGWSGVFKKGSQGLYVNFSAVPVPEPGVGEMLVLGLLLSASRAWRRFR